MKLQETLVSYIRGHIKGHIAYKLHVQGNAQGIDINPVINICMDMGLLRSKIHKCSYWHVNFHCIIRNAGDFGIAKINDFDC